MRMFERMGRDGAKAGDVGIEVEMEGEMLPHRVPKHWVAKGEGSLRGEAYEYVLREPCSEATVDKKLKVLWDQFKATGSELRPSNRCSVHCHINIQPLTEIQLFNFIVLYLIAEDALVRWCGDGREGNLFCLRAKDAEFVIDALEDTSIDGQWGRLHTDQLRYAAMNCKAIMEFGSLEFRAMRGTDDPEEISQWAGMLLNLRRAALLYDSPDQIINGFSEGGEEAFCRGIFGDDFDELFSYKGWEKEVTGGMRRCQCIAYSGDWKRFRAGAKYKGKGIASGVGAKVRARGKAGLARHAGDGLRLKPNKINMGDWVIHNDGGGVDARDAKLAEREKEIDRLLMEAGQPAVGKARDEDLF